MIRTPRLVLRPWVDADFPALHALLSDPVTMRAWPAPFDEEQSRAWLERATRSWAENGFGRAAVVLASTGEIIGDAGLMRAEIDGKQEIDLGYILARKFWGQGYATEAARAWLEHGLGEFKLSRICVIMDLENHASKRVAERLSVRLERTFKFSRNRGREAYLFAAER